jgi:hypothetical protein
MSRYFRNLARQARRSDAIAGGGRPRPIRDPTSTIGLDPEAVPPEADALAVAVHRAQRLAFDDGAAAREGVASPIPARAEEASPRRGDVPARPSETVHLHERARPAEPAVAAEPAGAPERTRQSDSSAVPVEAARQRATASEAGSESRQPWPAERSIIRAQWAGVRAESRRAEVIAEPSRRESSAAEIHVSIGRIEVSAVAAALPARPVRGRRNTPTMSLAEYEAKRRDGRR